MAKRRQKLTPEYDLDIVIPVYGQADLLSKCLASIDVKARVILVDDCGPEQDKLKEVYSGLNGNSTLIRQPQNSGFARTVNTGVNRGNSPLVLLLNSDIELKPGAIQAMIDEFNNPEVGIVGPKLIFGDHRWQQYGKIQHAGMAVNWFGQFIHVNIGWSPEHHKVNQRREMQAVTGACLMIRRKIWKDILAQYKGFGDPTTGALNEIYTKGCYEDIELCFAARGLGYKVIYQPKAEALHYVGASVTGAGEAYPIQRNELIFRARCGHLLQFDEYRWT